jgi:predicted DNA-binding transcriptional regulator YafY
MNRFDRLLGLVLFLRGGQPVSAAELARRFEVSRRTIYRDLETLSGLGVPVYAERGREGGFQLLEGYFLPPLMFSTGEAVSLLLGLALLTSLRAKPFAAELEIAGQKLLAALPERLAATLAEIQKIIGFETLPDDMYLHPELAADQPPATVESQTISLFLQAILERREVWLDYKSPYRAGSDTLAARPCGVFWDRDHWYLVGRRGDQDQMVRFWRADRVLAIKLHRPAGAAPADFDVRDVLGRSWLKSAMAHWLEAAPVKIRLTPAQAERLQRDWYYRHARFEQISEHEVLMTYGENKQSFVLELLRWLGPGAELLEPREWREVIKEELKQMLAPYNQD